jgi:hypothetical protein
MKTNETKKASVKNVSNFAKFWNNLKENKGTVNKCLIDFVNTCNMAKGDNFTKFCNSLFDGKTNKELNKKYYKDIATACKYGETITIKKNESTTIQYTKKCSEFDIYKYFYNLYKKANESK